MNTRIYLRYLSYSAGILTSPEAKMVKDAEASAGGRAAGSRRNEWQLRHLGEEPRFNCFGGLH